MVLVMCGLLTYNKGEAAKKEKLLQDKKTSYETQLSSAKERQKELEEEVAYRQTKQFIEDSARSHLGLVKPDEILLREAE
ncbi:MAG: septum formation initiator family protein [Lachnospiraceae bacterium]|nr:septum formation initiator family protein [Lachnospiraceae bacterium]